MTLIAGAPPPPTSHDDSAIRNPHSAIALRAFLVALYAAARLHHLTASCLWFDEIFSVHAARHSWRELWRFAAADLIHPPLFYALLKIWLSVGGDSLLWLRLFPFVASLLALAPFFLLARELRLGAAATDIALLLMAANGYLIKYAQEVRMYSLLLLLTLFSLWLFARLFNSERATHTLILALTFVNLLLVYTHYYGWLVVACEAAFLLLRDRRKLRAFLISSVAVAFLFVPWVFACAREAGEGGGLAQNIGWIARPGVRELWQFFALLNEPFYYQQSSNESLYALGGAILGLLLFGLPIAFLILKALKQRRQQTLSREGARHELAKREGVSHEDALLFLSFFTLLPVALAFAASRALPHSVWGERHLIIVAAPYLLLAGVALARLRPVWLKSAAIILLCCWFILAGALMFLRRDENYIWCTWESLAASAARDEAQLSSNDPEAARPVNVFAFEDLVAYHLWFALDGGGEHDFKVVVVKGLPNVAEDPAYFLPRRFDGVAKAAGADSLGGERFFAAFRASEWDESRPPLKIILERGYRVERTYETSAQGQCAFLVLFTRAD
jgi:hypothetical protein